MKPKPCRRCGAQLHTEDEIRTGLCRSEAGLDDPYAMHVPILRPKRKIIAWIALAVALVAMIIAILTRSP